MRIARYIAFGVLGAMAIAGLAAYIGLIADGSVPAPDLQGIANSLVPVATGGMAVVIGLVALAVIVCTAAAPFLFALRSNDALTIVVSLVLTLAMVGVFISGGSVIQEILGALIYIANIILSTVVYAVHRAENRT